MFRVVSFFCDSICVHFIVIRCVTSVVECYFSQFSS